MLGFDMKLGAAFNDNQQMASTAGAPGASFRQSTATIPGTSVPFTLIEFKNVERKHLSGRTQDPGTTVLQLVVRDVTALTAKLKAAGVPIVSAPAARPSKWRRGSRSRSCATRTTCCSSSSSALRAERPRESSACRRASLDARRRAAARPPSRLRQQSARMSLRVRLNLLITVMFVTILVLGALLVIHNARGAVAEETQSTARLALQLLEVAYASASPGGQEVLRARLREQMPDVESARHLQVALIEGDRELPLAVAEPARRADAPQWFARLVEPAATELRRSVASAAGTRAEIVVRADPERRNRGIVGRRAAAAAARARRVDSRERTAVRGDRPLAAARRANRRRDGRNRAGRLPRAATRVRPAGARNVASKFNHMAEVLERSREQNRYLAQQTLADPGGGAARARARAARRARPVDQRDQGGRGVDRRSEPRR